MPLRPHRLALPLLPLTLVLGACGSAGTTGAGAGDQGASASGGSGSEGNAPLTVVTSAYPVQWLTEQVAGDRADISVLTAPGADPHDVELTPRVVGSLGSADLVIYSSGLQPAVDEAVAGQAADHALDVAESADLVALDETAEEHDAHSGEEEESAEGHADDEDSDASALAEEPEEEHADDESGSEDGHDDHGAVDPHFWLDPERYGTVAEAIADELATLDPEHAQTYEDNAEALVAELAALDQEFTDGLASCEHRDLVTTHEAFGYLADRYDLHQIGITGITPDSEPSPARLAEVSATIDELGVQTVYAEPILSDAVARTVAQETGADVLTLDPLEGITESSPGDDYLEVMRANLAALQKGLSCS